MDLESTKKWLRAEVKVGKRKLALFKKVNESVDDGKVAVGVCEAAPGDGAAMGVPLDFSDSEGEPRCSGVVCGHSEQRVVGSGF